MKNTITSSCVIILNFLLQDLKIGAQVNEYLAEEQEHLVDLLVQRDAHIEHLTNQLMLITEQNRNLQNDLNISNDQLNIAVSLCVVWKKFHSG